MILYNLNCECGHEFEQWFDNSAAFDTLKAQGSLKCPDCGSNQVGKAVMAPRLGKKSAATATLPPCMGGEAPACCGCKGGVHNH